MQSSTKMICFSTLFMLLAAVTTIAVTYTNFVQAELKEDISEIRKNQEIRDARDQITNEKITALQLDSVKQNVKLDVIISKLTPEN